MVGSTVSHYKVLEKLSEGGMGLVYRAQDLTLQRQVALKFPPADALSDPMNKARFLREAQAVAALNHPNICTVYEIGEVEGHPFIAMELVEGCDLRSLVRERPLPLDQAFDIAIQACEGLQAAHKKGVVHRDIKSANLMLAEDGRVKLMDFGLAHVGGRTQLTKSGTTLGTPAYMSPEQALAQDADHRSDIWSLGVVLCELISGQLPFKGQVEAAITYGIVNLPHEPLTALRSGLPIELDRILDKALAKDREDRYQAIDSMAADLRVLRKVSSVKPARPAPLRTSSLPTRRAIVVGSTVVVAVLAFGTVGVRFLLTPRTVDSLAVLPFINETNDEKSQYLIDGIAEGVITQLSRASALRVLSWDVVSHYPWLDRDARTIGGDLGVSAVLRSRLGQRGELIQIRSELIDVRDGSVLWRDQYEESLGNLLGFDDRISRSVAGSLGLATDFAAIGVSKQGTLDAEAYRLYLEGRYYLDQRGDGIERSRRIFQQAVDRDPGFALAWSGLADSFLMLGGWYQMSPDESGPRARAAAEQAIKLDPTLAEPHATLAYEKTLREWDWPGAEREFRRAVQLDPNYGTAHHWFAFYWLTMGNVPEALAEIERARTLSPLSPIINSEVVYFYSFAGQLERAQKEAAKVINLNPDDPGIRRILCRIYALQGMREQLEQNIQELLRLDGENPTYLAVAAAALGRIGETARARDLLADALETSGGAPLGWTALAYANLGDSDKAFEYYEKSIDNRSLVASWLRDPLLDRISDDPRFGRLFERMGLKQ